MVFAKMVQFSPLQRIPRNCCRYLYRYDTAAFEGEAEAEGARERVRPRFLS